MNEQEKTDIAEENPCIIHTGSFDGPLDVLWELIKKSKIDITEISLSHITEQYIQFIKEMDKLNVQLASEFIWMASELLFYKSRALLPTEGLEDEYFVQPLPPELVQKLIEYKQYQQASEGLKKRFDDCSDHFTRENIYSGMDTDEEYIDVSLFDILQAFVEVLESTVTVEEEKIVFDEILVSERIEAVTRALEQREFLVFTEVFGPRPSRALIVASFLAILEMSRLHMVRIVQYRNFGEIRIMKNAAAGQGSAELSTGSINDGN